MKTFIFALSLVIGLGAHGETGSITRYTDDDLIRLHSTMSSSQLVNAIRSPKFPDEGRPKEFFDALADRFDLNHDQTLSAAELKDAIQQHVERYRQLLEESSNADGPQQFLAAQFRVKTWKMLQKLLLLDAEFKGKSLRSWKFAVAKPARPDASWDREHTITSRADFLREVCEASKTKPVVVKFGQTQCADCALMEWNQGIRTAALGPAKDYKVLKFWWGPSTSDEMDDLRKIEGVKSSPTFMVYSNGHRMNCGYAFTTAEGKGLEKCLSRTTPGEVSPQGLCAL